MDKTAVQTSPNMPAPPPSPPEPVLEPSPFVRRYHPVMQVFRALGSMRITVTLLALSLVLVYAGTVGQLDEGIWTVVNKYFRCFYVFITFKILLLNYVNVPGGFPFPGGFTIGAAMLLNMLCAYCFRYPNWTSKRIGVFILHAGLIVMLAGEVVTYLAAHEGRMTIAEGDSSSYAIDIRSAELAVALPCADDPKFEDEVVVPASLLKKQKVVKNDALPFDVELVRFMVNSDEPRPPQEGEENAASAGFGRRLIAPELPEVSGVATQQTADVPAAYVTLKTKEGESLGTYMLSAHLLRPQVVTVNGKNYELALRFKRTYLPYSLHLVKFSFDRHEGTQMSKNYSSLVVLDDPEQNVHRELNISMNDPLRHRSETIYQADFDHATEKATVLQIVHNPGRWLPYISCVLVATGMLVHFGMALRKFLNRRYA